MNVHAPFGFDAPARARFTVDDVHHMVESGLLDRDQSTELLDGELILMPSEGALHLTFKSALTRALILSLTQDWRLVPDGTLHLAPDDAPEPDIYILPASASLQPTAVASLALVLEIADTSLGHDLGRKSRIYARHGVQEYWVVDLNGRQTFVSTRPEHEAYSDIRRVPFEETLTPLRLPSVSLRLSELPQAS